MFFRLRRALGPHVAPRGRFPPPALVSANKHEEEAGRVEPRLAEQWVLKTGAALADARGREYAVVAGAVTGGGLTVIANAPNPAGQSILNKYFKNGISPIGLLFGALFPTLIMAFVFMVLPH